LIWTAVGDPSYGRSRLVSLQARAGQKNVLTDFAERSDSRTEKSVLYDSCRLQCWPRAVADTEFAVVPNSTRYIVLVRYLRYVTLVM